MVVLPLLVACWMHPDEVVALDGKASQAAAGQADSCPLRMQYSLMHCITNDSSTSVPWQTCLRGDKQEAHLAPLEQVCNVQLPVLAEQR